MTWFTRKIDLEEDADALASDVDEEFDNIKSAFNGLFTVGVEAATEDLALSSSYADIPGAEVTLKPTAASHLLVVAVFDFKAASNLAECKGTIRVDSTDQTPEARLFPEGADLTDNGQGTVTQVYDIELSSGSHTIKQRAKYNTVAGGTKALATHTRFLYLMIPDPEP